MVRPAGFIILGRAWHCLLAIFAGLGIASVGLVDDCECKKSVTKPRGAIPKPGNLQPIKDTGAYTGIHILSFEPSVFHIYDRQSSVHPMSHCWYDIGYTSCLKCAKQRALQGWAEEMSPVWKVPPPCCQTKWPANAQPNQQILERWGSILWTYRQLFCSTLYAHYKQKKSPTLAPKSSCIV